MRAPGAEVALSTVVAATAQFGAGAFDLCALNDVKAELQLTDTSNDVWLAKVITRLSREANAFCNRPLVAQTYRERIWTFRDAYPWQSPQRIAPLQLSRWPINAAPSPAGTAPPLAPALSAASGSAASARTLYARASYVTASGETPAGPEASIILAAGQALTVAAPGADPRALAIGWNLYVGGAAGAEARQNSTPLALGAGWSEPSGGYSATGTALPAYVLVVENAAANYASGALSPVTLAEGVDFVVDAASAGLTRLFLDGTAQSWTSLPLDVVYPAGLAVTPAIGAATLGDDIQDALIQWVKMRWFSRLRDPLQRSSNVVGVYEQTFVMGTGPGGADDMPAAVTAALERYRMPVAC
jgi:hypothetical protein